MKRPWHPWLTLGLALAVLLGGMAWVSLTALRLDAAQADARQRAAREGKVRLALWRMDSALAPLISQENAQPYFAYSPFSPAERAYTKMFQKIEHGEVLVPSPLLTAASPHILLHFQFAPDGALSSPQVPTGNMRDLAESGYTTHEKIEAAAARLADLADRLTRAKLVAVLPGRKPKPAVASGSATPAAEQPPVPSTTQEAQTSVEWQARVQRTRQAYNIAQSGAPAQTVGPPGADAPRVHGELMRPVWLAGALLLARRVTVDGGDYVQGCWLDWPAIRSWLVGDVRDLLPEARLEPVTSDGEMEPSRMLAGLPVRLVPGALRVPRRRGLSAVALSLLIAWGCVLLAGIGAAGVLSAVMSLSERRAAFVSAVTHEMRTPLTTFQMYTEMLSEGMVDAAKTQRYLSTLRAEAQRLGHLVENVLAYARLEQSPKPRRTDAVTLTGLVSDLRERFAERTRQAGMRFVVEAGRDEFFVRADVSAVERILFNLIDNSCKYAASGPDKRIHLVLDRVGRFARLRVWDHGPGISAELAARLFRPFSKSAHDAAHSAPGIGLGLALSRRLARRMGGDLVLDRSVAAGACFALTLPVSS